MFAENDEVTDNTDSISADAPGARRRERQRQGVELAKRAGKYAGRQADTTTHERIIALRSGGRSIAETAKLAGCSESQVKRVWSMRTDVPA